jgi:hypothetical protein
MNPDRLAESESIFQEVADLSPRDREAILSERCGDDAELRALIERLLAHHDGAMGSFLESPSLEARGQPTITSSHGATCPRIPADLQAVSSHGVTR